MINSAGILDHHAAVRPNKTALVWDGDRCTYRELSERVNAIAAALREAGVGPGDRVALLMHNRPEFIEAIYAINRLGAAFLPLNFRLAPAEWSYILTHAQVAGIITEFEFEGPLAAATKDLELPVRLSVGDTTTDEFGKFEDFVAPFVGRVIPVADVAKDAMQRLMYTSGTTSRPKGVCISHENFAWKNLGMLVQFGWDDTEVAAIGGPLYHVGALDIGGLTILQSGGTLVLQLKFDADELLTLIEKHNCTTTWLAPAMVNAILQSPELSSRDLTSLKLILSGGEKMPESRLAQILDAVPGVWFADAYGLTETVSSDTFMDREHMQSKIGSVGLPLPHQEVRITQPDGTVASPNTAGEIALRGPKVFTGYWRDPEATEAVIRNGWFYTGDIGRIDEDGYLYVEDRKKDMIVSGGENIASPEVERALFEHPAVLEAAVVASPDEKWGEVPQAFVVLRSGEDATAEEIIEFCRERLARFKVPRIVNFASELPRTPSGKVLKRQLRDDDTSSGEA